MSKCNYQSCDREVGDEGVIVDLETPAPDGETHAEYCCIGHAQAAMRRLAIDRGEVIEELP